MADSSTVAKVSMLRYILLNVALPLLLFLIFIIVGYIFNGLLHNYQNKQEEVIRLAKVLATSAASKDTDLIASQVSLSMLRYPAIGDIQFYSIEHVIELDTNLSNDWKNAFINQSASFHEEVLVSFADATTNEVATNNNSTADTALIGYINITLDLQELRKQWFQQNLVILIFLIALFLLILLLIYMRLFLPLSTLSDMASEAKDITNQEDMALESFIYSDKEFDEIEAVKQLVAKLDKRYKQLLESYDSLSKKNLVTDNRQGAIQNSNLQSMIIHELKSSLNDISDGLKMIGRSYLSEEQAKAIAVIRTGNNELDFTLNQIIQLDRIEKGQLGVSYDELQPAQLINSVVQAHDDKAAKKGLVIHTHIHHIDHVLAGDAKKIQTILNELLLNAIEYTQSGDITVNSSMMYFVDSIRWTIKISDTGSGIDSKYLDDIFTPFFQMDNAKQKEYEGLGVGLGIAKKLAELLDGSLTVESEINVGTTFTLTLQLRSWHSNELFTLLKNIKIVALQHKDSTSYVQDLEVYGPSIDVFTDAFELIEQLQNNPSDVLLISDEISRNTVYDLCQSIRNQETSHRVLIIWYQTNIATHDLAELEAVGLDYILNPTSSKQFQANEIRSWVMG